MAFESRLLHGKKGADLAEVDDAETRSIRVALGAYRSPGRSGRECRDSFMGRLVHEGFTPERARATATATAVRADRRKG